MRNQTLAVVQPQLVQLTCKKPMEAPISIAPLLMWTETSEHDGDFASMGGRGEANHQHEQAESFWLLAPPTAHNAKEAES